MRGSSEQGSDVTAAGPQLVIWGTDVVVNQCKEKFVRFLSRFIDETVDEDERFDGMDVREPYYMQRLEEVQRMRDCGFVVFDLYVLSVCVCVCVCVLAC